jgi:hypothetical protein
VPLSFALVANLFLFPFVFAVCSSWRQIICDTGHNAVRILKDGTVRYNPFLLFSASSDSPSIPSHRTHLSASIPRGRFIRVAACGDLI